MKPTVLLFNFAPEKITALKKLSLRLGLQMITVPPDRFGHTLEALLADTMPSPLPSAGFSDEMLVMCGLYDPMIDMLLHGLRLKQVDIPLKAVLTDTNRTWTAVRLHNELCREREAITAGTQVHTS